MNFSEVITTLIFDGNPNGMIMCELSNWIGRVYKISRTELNKFSERDDAESTGVYYLFGKNEYNEETIYIGEAENILTRLKQHLDKDYWNECVVVISKDNILNKAHIKYMENKFYCMATEASRSNILNSNTPTCSTVSESDEAMLAKFINNTKLLVNTLGYKVFDSIEDSAVNDARMQTKFYIKAARGADAVGSIVSDGFVVYENSKIANSATPSMADSLKKLRLTLIDKKIINSEFKFTKDYVFTSPSLAAAVVMGRNANGRTEWKTLEHKSIKDIEEESILNT
ncbi:MAG: GIY-YIG nuclease family protein [Clostridia bacterium]|nr:GIY-YIG nuclease family protein [Clostridia bacterium]